MQPYYDGDYCITEDNVPWKVPEVRQWGSPARELGRSDTRRRVFRAPRPAEPARWITWPDTDVRGRWLWWRDVDSGRRVRTEIETAVQVREVGPWMDVQEKLI